MATIRLEFQGKIQSGLEFSGKLPDWIQSGLEIGGVISSADWLQSDLEDKVIVTKTSSDWLQSDVEEVETLGSGVMTPSVVWISGSFSMIS